jgi:methionyl-tRNA formyltransferase
MSSHPPTANKFSFVFFGTDDFAVHVLEELTQQSCLPQLIVTTPDKPKGRNLVLTPPAVKVWADTHNIPAIQPEKLSTIPKELITTNYPLFLVASYGKIIPEAILSLPTHGTLNIHPSLLPQYRGPTPLQTAILDGQEYSGVSIMLLDKEIDHGPILTQDKVLIKNKSFITLQQETATVGAKLFLITAPLWLEGQITAKPQDHSKATFTKKLIKTDGEITLRDDPTTNYRKFLALTPWPGIYFFTPNNTRVKVTAAHMEDGEFILDKVIPEGKKETNGAAYS